MQRAFLLFLPFRPVEFGERFMVFVHVFVFMIVMMFMIMVVTAAAIVFVCHKL